MNNLENRLKKAIKSAAAILAIAAAQNQYVKYDQIKDEKPQNTYSQNYAQPRIYMPINKEYLQEREAYKRKKYSMGERITDTRGYERKSEEGYSLPKEYKQEYEDFDNKKAGLNCPRIQKVRV